MCKHMGTNVFNLFVWPKEIWKTKEEFNSMISECENINHWENYCCEKKNTEFGKKMLGYLYSIAVHAWGGVM